MKIECIGGTGPQWIVFYNQEGQYTWATPAPYDGVQLVGSAKCGVLWIDETPAVPMPIFEANITGVAEPSGHGVGDGIPAVMLSELAAPAGAGVLLCALALAMVVRFRRLRLRLRPRVVAGGCDARARTSRGPDKWMPDRVLRF